MGGLFGKPKTPKVEAPPPTPTVDASAQQQQERDYMARRRKARKTVIAGGNAGTGQPGQTGSKTLLGQ